MKILSSLALLLATTLPANATGVFGLGLVQRQVIVQRVRVAPVVQRVVVQRQVVAVKQVVAVQRVVAPVFVHSAIIAPVQAYSLVQPVYGYSAPVQQLRSGPEKVTEKLDPATGRVVERVIER